MKRILCLLMLLMLASVAAFSDIARPDKSPNRVPKPKSIDTTMTIRLQRDATEAKLLIPKSQIKQLRAALEQLDDATDDTAAATSSFSRTQTIVSGLFLSLAFVFGGVWFARARKNDGKINKTAAAAIMLFLVGASATAAFANMGPPTELRSISSKLFNKQIFGGWNSATGKIKIEVTEKDGGPVELVVPDKPEPKADE